MIAGAPHEAPSAPAPAAPRRTWLNRLAAVPGWLAVVAMLGSLGLAFVPLSNPGVQTCGSPALFLLDGKVDRLPDANGRVQDADGTIRTLTKAQQDRAFNHKCSARVADRIVPLAATFGTGAIVGLVVLLASMVVWWRHSPPARPRPLVPPPNAAP